VLSKSSGPFVSGIEAWRVAKMLLASVFPKQGVTFTGR